MIQIPNLSAQHIHTFDGKPAASSSMSNVKDGTILLALPSFLNALVLKELLYLWPLLESILHALAYSRANFENLYHVQSPQPNSGIEEPFGENS